MIVYDSLGNKYSLTETNKKGGEGRLYSVDESAIHYAKIFNPEKRTRGREAKIREWEKMYTNGMLDDSFLEQVVVPQRCLYENPTRQDYRSFVGYLMEKQTNFRDLSNVYSENELSYLEKVWVARNICTLTYRVHNFEREVVIGDYNADNVAVFMSTLKAKLIDVDSFQLMINRGGRSMRCPCTVCVPEYLAPEINRRLKKEKADLVTVDQTNDPYIG